MIRSRLCLFAACLTASGVFAACSSGRMDGKQVKGSGVVKSESRELAGFSSISLGSVGKVTVRQTGRDSLTIRADDNILPLLESRLVGRTLRLDIAKDVNIDPVTPIEYAVEVESLEGLNTTGAGNIEATEVHSPRMSVSISGVGKVAVAGSAEALDLNLSGVGSYQGEGLKTKQAVVRSSGVGTAVVNASELLDVTISGVGSVEYVGSPTIRKSVSGLGTVKPL